MECSCGSFSMICQQACNDLEKCLTSGKKGVTIGSTVLELEALGFLWRRVSQERRRALEMFSV